MSAQWWAGFPALYLILEDQAMDLVYVALVLLFLASSRAMMALCERLSGSAT